MQCDVVCRSVLQCVAVLSSIRHHSQALPHFYPAQTCVGSKLAPPRVERTGLTLFARRNKACVFILSYVLILGLSPEIPSQYSEKKIIARDSHSNRLKSEKTENTYSVYWSFIKVISNPPVAKGPGQFSDSTISPLYCVVVWCSVSQCVVMCCSVLQRVVSDSTTSPLQKYQPAHFFGW